jgi:hypothetical protein
MSNNRSRPHVQERIHLEHLNYEQVVNHDDIALLAYAYWEERGRVDGYDQFGAEAELGRLDV